jgi:Cu-processing system ATP-binding protein
LTRTVLEFTRVTKRYGEQEALRGVSLAVSAGECLALLGHNGAGKTTAMKLALGLSRPNSGEVRVLGADPAEGKARQRGQMIGFLPESIAFHDAMTGREMLAFYARLKGEPLSLNGALFERVGLAAAADKRIKTYSKGMRQRLGLAQALLGRPRLLLLDEPTSGLDPAFRRSFYDLLLELTRGGSSVVLSSHALSELETRIDRVAIIQSGKLIAHGSLAELSEGARLKAKIRIAVPAGRTAALAQALRPDDMLTRVNDCSLELSCTLDEKLALLRRIGGLEIPVEDIEVTSPTLDDVFAHFTTIEAGQ